MTVMMTCCQEEERSRLDISVRPRPWEPRVVRAPVPWHQSFLQVRGGGANGGADVGEGSGADGGEGGCADGGGANGLVVTMVVMLVLQASQFCRHNLFSLNTVMVKLNDLWWRRWGTVRQCSAGPGLHESLI